MMRAEKQRKKGRAWKELTMKEYKRNIKVQEEGSQAKYRETKIL